MKKSKEYALKFFSSLISLIFVIPFYYCLYTFIPVMHNDFIRGWLCGCLFMMPFSNFYDMIVALIKERK